jgi:hypothetical protein
MAAMTLLSQQGVQDRMFNQGVGQDRNLHIRCSSYYTNKLLQALDKVSIAVDWPSGSTIPFNEADCDTYLNTVSDGCDGNDPSNHMNWKGGGTIYVNKASYHIDPKATRQPLPNKPDSSRDV